MTIIQTLWLILWCLAQLFLPLGFPLSLVIWPFPYITGRVFAGIAVCLPSRPDTAVPLIHIVPCLPPPCCLTEESLDDVCHLESDPFIIAPPGCENPAVSCPICRPQCLTEWRIDHLPSQELSQLRAKTNSLGLPERRNSTWEMSLSEPNQWT